MIWIRSTTTTLPPGQSVLLRVVAWLIIAALVVVGVVIAVPLALAALAVVALIAVYVVASRWLGRMKRSIPGLDGRRNVRIRPPSESVE